MKYQPDLCADVPIVGLVGADELARGACARFDDLLADEPMAGTIAADPAEPGADRVHLGHHQRSEGRHPQPSDAGLRDPPAAGELPARPRQAADGDTGRALHRHARRVPDPRAGGRADRSVRRVGPGQGARVDRERRPVDRRRAAVLRHQPARPSRLHRRAHVALHNRRPRRVDGAGGGHPAAGRHGHVRVPLLRQYRASVDHRIEPRRAGGQAALHRRRRPARGGDPARPGRRDLQPRTGSVPGLHRRRVDRARPSTPTAGIAPAMSACSTRTATSRSPTARPTSSSAAARTSARSRSRRCCWRCPQWPRPWWWPRRTSGSGSARPRCCGVRAGHDHADDRRGARALRGGRGGASRNGQRNCTRSTTTRAPRAARCRSSWSGRGLPPNIDENRILSR